MTELPEQSEVPIWPRFIPHVLQVLSDGSIIRRRDLVARVLDSAELSESARAERIAVGDGRADNRVGWALTSLFKAGWVERPERAKYRITPDGLKWLRENPDAEPDFGDANRLFKEYWPHTQPQHGESAGIIADAATESEISPIEQIESGIARITEEVADDLLTRLRDSDPSFFEDAVVRLLLAMGYGGAEQRGNASAEQATAGSTASSIRMRWAWNGSMSKRSAMRRTTRSGAKRSRHSSGHCMVWVRIAGSSSPRALSHVRHWIMRSRFPLGSCSSMGHGWSRSWSRIGWECRPLRPTTWSRSTRTSSNKGSSGPDDACRRMT